MGKAARRRPPHQPYGGEGFLACLQAGFRLRWLAGFLGFLSQTLESQLAAVRKGRKISEDEIPPPVALGKRQLAAQEIADRSSEADAPAPCTMEPGIGDLQVLS